MQLLLETFLMGQIGGEVIPHTVHFDCCSANRFSASSFKSESELRKAFTATAFNSVR